MTAKIVILSGALCAVASVAFAGPGERRSDLVAAQTRAEQPGKTAQAAPRETIPDTMGSFDFALGKWRCNGLTPAGKVDYTFTQEINKVMNGHWFRSHDVSREGTGDAFWTYDGKRHRWVYLSIDDSGGYSMGSSPGWTGTTQTWTGYAYSRGRRRSWGRIIFKKVSEREKREDFFAPSKNGRAQFQGSEVCTKMD